jgi:hypothetical protein
MRGAGVSLDDLPMRRTDNARILDTSKHAFHHQGVWADTPVFLRRPASMPDSSCFVECQQRLTVGRLPIAYRCAVQEIQEFVAAGLC